MSRSLILFLIDPDIVVRPSSCCISVNGSQCITGQTWQFADRGWTLHKIEGYAAVAPDAAHRTFASRCCLVVHCHFRRLSHARIGVKPAVDDGLSWTKRHNMGAWEYTMTVTVCVCCQHKYENATLSYEANNTKVCGWFPSHWWLKAGDVVLVKNFFQFAHILKISYERFCFIKI